MLAVGCADDPAAHTCEPGATQRCFCSSGAVGAQVCSGDGSRWEICICAGADADADILPDAEDDGDADVEEDVPVDAEAESDAPVDAEAESDAPVDVEAESDAPVDAEAESDAPVDAEAESDAPADVEAESDAPADVDAEAEADVSPGCGDGVLDPGEACDDGNRVPGDGCENDCTITPGFCGPHAVSCPNDPVDGPVGRACASEVDCEATFDCWEESISYFRGDAYVSWAGGYCLTWGWGTAGCDPAVPGTCPAGATCVYLGSTGGGTAAYGCLDACAVASATRVPWDGHCDCRDGYECSLTGEFCIPGCSNDAECCEIWDDRNSDGVRQAAEVTAAPGCLHTCDACRGACTQEGCAGGSCSIGGACVHESQCPAMGRCLAERYYSSFVGGMCVQDRCDLVGRECPAGAGCANLGDSADPFHTCMRTCTVGGVPGGAGFACRDVGTPGPSAGDQACYPALRDLWFDATTADGYCYPGNFPGGATRFGRACTADTQCISPLGLGACYELLGRPGFCGAVCSEAMAADGFCEIDGAAVRATGLCFSDMCLESCDTPNGPLGANGCSSAGMACYPTTLFGTYVYVTTGKTVPPGLCFPACPNHAFCADMWTGGSTCNTTTGVCALAK
jgi:cysteine-rich repeat protein